MSDDFGEVWRYTMFCTLSPETVGYPGISVVLLWLFSERKNLLKRLRQRAELGYRTRCTTVLPVRLHRQAELLRWRRAAPSTWAALCCA
jgi:hypothetical protein